MGKISENRGQITVFVALLILPVIVFGGIFVDLARITEAKALAERTLRTSAGSVLAGYSGILKDRYGVFGYKYPYQDKNALMNQVKGYISDSQGLKLESIEIGFDFDLLNKQVFKQQILEYMKYRAPANLAIDVYERLEAASGAGKMAEAYKKKTNLDKLLNDIGEEGKRLAGYLLDTRSISTGFSSELEENILQDTDNDAIKAKEDWDASADWLISLANKYLYLLVENTDVDKSITELIKDIEDLKEKTADIDVEEVANSSENGSSIELIDDGTEENTEASTDESSKVGSEESTEKIIGEMEEKLALFEKEKSDIVSEISIARNQYFQSATYLKSKLEGAFLEANKKALASITDILKMKNGTSSEIIGYENYINENFTDAKGLEKTFADTARKDIAEVKRYTGGDGILDLIKEALSQNILSISGSIQAIDKISTDITLSGEVFIEYGIQKAGEIFASSMGTYSYGLYDEFYSLFAESSSSSNESSSEKGVDLRKLSAIHASERIKCAESSNENDKEDINLIDYGIELGSLPSRRGLFFDDYVESDIWDNVGFSTNSSFTINALDFFGNLKDILKEGFILLRDEVYINQFILDNFKNTVKHSTKNVDYSQTFFNSEVEYVINGNPSEKKNKLLTEGKILLIRFGLNTLHVYTDPGKKEAATLLATALAGWWTGGAGIPLLSNLLMCGWGMGEALLDLSDLMKGNKVAFYKTKEDWILDIGILNTTVSDSIAITQKMDSAEGGIDFNKILSFDYEDYLSLFLMLTEPETKIGRTQDLVEINLKKTNPSMALDKLKTSIEIDAVFSVNYIFLTSLFVPEAYKTETGRHKIKVEVFSGY